MTTDLPPGFVLESDLPPGFVIEPERSLTDRALRMAGNFGAGFNQAAVNTLTAIPEAVAGGMRWAGLPAPPAGTYQQAAQGALDYAIGPAPTPETTGERFAHGAGRGVADAASVFMPATALAGATRAGTTANAVRQALAASPALQVASGAAGGGVAEATDSPLAGLAASLAVPVAATAAQGMAARLRAPVTNHLDPRQQELVRVLQDEGITLRPSQATGSKTLSQIEEVIGRFPGAIDRFAVQTQKQQKDLNRAVARYMGENADTVTPEVLERARDRIGQVFDDVLARNKIVPDQQLVADVQKTVNDYVLQLPSQQKPQFPRYVDDLLEFLTNPNKPEMPAEALQNIRSRMTKQIASLKGPNADTMYRGALEGLRDALDDAMTRQAQPGDATLWRNARRQYAALSAIEGAVARDSGGDIKPNALAQALMTGRRREYARGLGQMDELAKAASEFLPQQIPNSGTPERAFWLGALLTPVGAAGGAAGANVAQRALESKAAARWLTAQRPQTASQVSPELMAAILLQNRERLKPSIDEALGLLPAR